MKFEIAEIEEIIVGQLNNHNITYNDIVTCTDEGKLLEIIEVVNAGMKDFSLSFTLDKFLYNEFILLSCHNIKLIINKFYLNVIL